MIYRSVPQIRPPSRAKSCRGIFIPRISPPPLKQYMAVTKIYWELCVAVPCSNWRLFRRSHRCVWNTVSLNFRGSYAVRRYSYLNEARMSPALNRSSAIWRFKHSNAIEMHDGITFDNILPDGNCKVVKCVVFFYLDTKLWAGHRKGGRNRERKCRIPRISPPPPCALY